MKRAISVTIVLLLTYATAVSSPKGLFAIRGYSNQSLCFVNLTTGEVLDSVVAVGPAANSLVLRGGRLYVVNSGGSYVGLNASITIYNVADIINDVRPLPAVVVQVPDYKNPYDMTFVSDTKAYVSYLLDSSVVVFDARSNTLGQRIQVGKGPEGLAVSGEKVYVANAYDPGTYAYGNTVSVISATADSVLRTVTVYTNPQYIGIDQIGRPHVVSTGPYDNSGRITVLNPPTDSTVGTVQMNGNISSVVFASSGTAYTSSTSLMSYNGSTLDTIRTGLNPYPIVGGSLAAQGDTLFVARTGRITLYDVLTLDSLNSFLLASGYPYYGLAVYSDDATDVPEQLPLPLRVALEQNYPNPFNPSTTIRFHIPEAAHVSLKIYDVVGREVATLVDGDIQPGSHATTWNAEGIASGVYFCRLEATGVVDVKKVLLMR